ncbi:vomeronasal type-1 receptor 4-like [Crocuta crocuta]
MSKSSRKLFIHRNGSHNLKTNILNDRIGSRDLTMAIIFLSQMTVGILGNFALLRHYVFHYHIKGRLRCTELILMHLIIANSLVMLSKGVPKTLAAFEVKDIFNEFGCKLLFYVQRVGRGMSIGSTCLLSVFQTIMISPMNSCWKDLKVKAPKYIGLSIFLFWIIYLIVNLIIPMYVLSVSGKPGSQNITKNRDYGYCSTSDHDTLSESLYVILIVFPEISLTGLMIWASSSMVFILHRHKQQVEYIHRANHFPRSSVESRATQSTLALVSTFVSFYFLSSIFHVCIVFMDNPSWWLMNTNKLVSECFPTVSPFLIMRRDSTVSRLCFPGIKNIFPSRKL